MKDFFISYNSADKHWAEWIAWQLEDNGYQTVIQAWDFLPGDNFVLGMHEAACDSHSTIIVLSPSFLNSSFAQTEWAAAFRQDPQGKERKLVPVRVRDCDPAGLLGQIIYIDLVGLDEPSAKARLLSGVKAERIRPASPPTFPVDSRRAPVAAPDYPGAQRDALKGLRPFGYEDAQLFQRLQRERELQACLTTITDRDFRIGILFGESGCGKTSFVQAGLWPMLPQFSPSHHPLYVKFSELDPLVSVRQAFKEQLQSSAPDVDNAGFLRLSEHATQALGKTLVLFFDQFEQFFVHFPQDQQRQPFVAALAEWYRHTPALKIKILLSLRQDYYAQHHELQQALGYSLGPQDSMPLRKLTPRQATEIFQVIAETTALTFDRSFVEEMTARELAGKDDGRISPVDIQILAWMISAQEESGALNRTTFQKMGGVEGLLENYLNRALAALATKAEQQSALKTMLALVDLENNVRAGVLTPEQIGNKLGTEVSAMEQRRLIAWLAQGKVRLLTPVEREGVWGYELAHERLIQPLRRLTNKQLTELDQANRLLEQRTNEWLGNDRASRYLLTWRELRRIEQQRNYLAWGKHAEMKKDLLKQSGRRLKQNLLIALSPIVLVIVLWLGWRFYEQQQFVQRRDQLAASDFELVQIRGGTFRMGDLFGDGQPDEKPVHQVTLSAFRMSKHEITNAQYCVFLNASPGLNIEGLIDLETSRIARQEDGYATADEFRLHPVVGVTWHGATAFCEWIGGRLPTEAQWEYAARAAGDSIYYPWGNEEPDTTRGNFRMSFESSRATMAVGSYLPNALGLYDMAGNVREWCYDWYRKYSSESQADPEGPTNGISRVVRGGSFLHRAWFVRCSYRYRFDPSDRYGNIGFRVVLSP